MKREASFNTFFNHWLKEVWQETGAFELKQSQTESLPFSALKDHQLQALLHTKHGTFVFKIPDLGVQNPFDAFSLSEEKAFVVVKYPRFFCLIDIDVWFSESSSSIRRSLTSARAKELSTVVVDL